MNDTTDWKPGQGWRQNFRKFRWFNLVIPVLTPLGLISIFLFGYLTFAVVAIVVAAFAWFDLGTNAPSKNRRVAWRVFATLMLLLSAYMVFLNFNPQLGF